MEGSSFCQPWWCSRTEGELPHSFDMVLTLC
jgi:hypothetical protein